LTLLEYRNTPISNDIPSPAQLLFGRKIKGNIPLSESFLKHKDANIFSEKFYNIQNKQKYNYDQKSRDLPEIKVNDSVMVQFGKIWEQGVVLKIDNSRPRSFVVKLNKNGKVFVRNRRFLKKYINSNICCKPRYSSALVFEQPKNQVTNNNNYSKSSDVQVCYSNTDNNPGTSGCLYHNDSSVEIADNISSNINLDDSGIVRNCREEKDNEILENNDINTNQIIDTKHTVKTNTVNRTRVGREIRKPGYLKDFY